MSWTDERIDLLKRRWTEGLSASQIANELGGVTRNAVIGKVHRLKLESRLKAPEPPVLVQSAAPTIVSPPRPPRTLESRPTMESASPPPRMVSGPSAPARPMMHSVGATALKMDPVADYYVQPAEQVERQSADIVPMSRNLTLVQLSERTCKWPLGDPLSAEFRFCGNHSGDASPYCKYHARIAFQPVSERRRAR